MEVIDFVVKAELPLFFIKYKTTKTYRGVEV